MNLRKQVEPLHKPRFRLPLTEACTPRSVAIRLWDETSAQTSLRTITHKAGNSNSAVDLTGELIRPASAPAQKIANFS